VTDGVACLYEPQHLAAQRMSTEQCSVVLKVACPLESSARIQVVWPRALTPYEQVTSGANMG
jgi:hypothetical protein